jgi:hypothetical protein
MDMFQERKVGGEQKVTILPLGLFQFLQLKILNIPKWCILDSLSCTSSKLYLDCGGVCMTV